MMDLDREYRHNYAYWVGRLSGAVQVALNDLGNHNMVAAERTLHEVLYRLEQDGPSYTLPWHMKRGASK
jgi:hypothetical protein